MPRGASSPRETMKWVFPKCRCPEGPRRQGKLWSECFPSVDAPRGLVAKGNYEVSVSQVSMPRGASSPRETTKWVFPKCRCPEGPRRQGKLRSECFPSVDAPRGLVAKGNYEVRVSQVSMPRGASSPRETMKWVFPKCRCPEGPRRQGKLRSECFPSVDAPRGLVAKGNYEVRVSQVSMPRGASSPRETMKWVFPKCRCPEGPRRQGKLWSECFPSVDAPRGLVAKGNYEVSVSQVSMPRGASSPRETMKWVFPKCRCPEGPRRQGKLCSEGLLSDWCLRGLVTQGKKSHYKWSYPLAFQKSFPFMIRVMVIVSVTCYGK